MEGLCNVEIYFLVPHQCKNKGTELKTRVSKFKTETLKKAETLRCKITQKRDFKTYHKRFRDFKIGPKFSEALVFKETILNPLEMMRYSYL